MYLKKIKQNEKTVHADFYRLGIVLLFVLFVCVGLYMVPDYGISFDEGIERRHGLVHYAYLFPAVRSLITPTADFTVLPLLADYADRFYGVGIQLPLVFIEGLTGFQMPLRSVFLMRHAYTFLLFAASSFCFYRLCFKVFQKRSYALCGWLMYVICPRILAHAFYNIKDSVFLSLFTMTLAAFYDFYEKRNTLHTAIFAIICAFAINCRIVAGVLPFFAVLFFIAKDLWNRTFRKNLKYYVMLMVCSLLIYLLITPAAWENPFAYVIKALLRFSNYTAWEGLVFYLGAYYPGTDIPWHYLPVMMFCTIPVVYSVLSVVGILAATAKGSQLLREKNGNAIFAPRVVFFSLCFCILTTIFLFVIIKRPVLYNGWRHFYFLYGLLVIFALYAISRLVRIRWTKYVVIAFLSVSVAFSTNWIVQAHPYECVYYNPLVWNSVPENFERDYWGLSLADACAYLAENVDGTINYYCIQGRNPLSMLDASIADRFVPCVDDPLEYVISYYSENASSEQAHRELFPEDKYEAIYEQKVFDLPICVIYRKI